MQLISIGRSSGNRIVISDPSVSNYHAEVLLGDDGSIFVTDKSSTNGTTVRGQRIQKETEVSVNRGDKVTFAGVADLDWSRIPVVQPPPPGWILYSIGSSLRSRIQVSDPSGRVSRYHATIKIDPKGKIHISDHSANGTSVNGVRIQSNQDVRVKRKDKISFADAVTLDWSKIAKKTSPAPVVAVIAALLLVGAGLFGYMQGWFSFSEWSLEKTYKTYSNSIVCVYHEYRIVATYGDGKQAVVDIDDDGELVKGQKPAPVQGTAFLIDRAGTLITNRHITIPWESKIEKFKQTAKYRNSNIEVAGSTDYVGIAYNKTSISRPTDFEECSVLSRKSDEVLKDVGMLRVKNLKQLPADFTPIELTNAFLDYKKIVIGEPIYLIGYPLGTSMFALTSEGTTNTVEVKLTSQAGAVSQVPDSYKFGHNAVALGGSSGSPIFNNRGQLIGVLNSGLSQTRGYAWGILVKHAKELYDRE